MYGNKNQGLPLLQEAETEVKRCKKAEEAAKNAWTDKEAEEAALKLEITQLQKNLEEESQQLASTEEAIQGNLSLFALRFLVVKIEPQALSQRIRGP